MRNYSFPACLTPILSPNTRIHAMEIRVRSHDLIRRRILVWAALLGGFFILACWDWPPPYREFPVQASLFENPL
ncbi:hypothetical protein C7212DRAFT_329290, partial [Tuber magnatum]